MTREKAIKIIKEFINGTCLHLVDQEALETLIPELRENEDERIIRAIIDALYSHTNSINLLSSRGYQMEDIEAWFKKQKENIEKEYVFRPLAGTDITIAAEQAIRKANEGDRLVLAFNGAYIPVRKDVNANKIVDIYDAFIEKQKEEEGYEAIPMESTLEYKLGFKAGKESEKQKETSINWMKSDNVKNPDKPYIDKTGMFYTTDGRMCYAFEIEKQKDQKDYNKLYEDIGKSEWFKKAYKGKLLGCDYEQKEQKPVKPSDDELRRYQDELHDFKLFATRQAKEHHISISFVHDFEWNNFCAELLSHFNEKQKPVEFTHHETNESLKDAVTHQMEDDGDIDDFVRKGIDDIALKYAMLGAEWQKEQKPAEVDESTKKLNDNWMKQYFDDYNEQKDNKFAPRVLPCSAAWFEDGEEKQQEQKPVSNPKWAELTWKDINELERIINNVHYEFQNGIGEDSFGELVLERFKEYKDDGSMDEQKPAEWSEEDEFFRQQLIVYCEKGIQDPLAAKCVAWLKSLRPQPKQERQIKKGDKVSIHCRKDREKDIIAIYDDKVGEVIDIWDKKYPWGHIAVKLDNDCNNSFHEDEIEVLDESHWKPSEEQMKALNKAIPVCMGVVGRDAVAPLESLCEELEKLM